MARQPKYPEDAAVETSPGAAAAGGEVGGKREEGSSRTRNIVAGAAIGIGSAALVAALLYANRSRRGDKS
jgi:hypothetical protein